MSWLVDAHVHYHPEFGWARFLDGALENTLRTSRADPSVGTFTATCLLMADPEGVDSIRDLTSSPFEAEVPGWRMERLEGGAVALEPPEPGPVVLLVPGRQVRTRERLELLALDCTRAIPDGFSLAETIVAAREANAIPVVPWGFGKWWLGRGRVVSDVLGAARGAAGVGATSRDAGRGMALHVGDNGNRPRSFPLPPLLARARRAGVLDLPGSDPLPFPDHARRAASCGFVLPGDPDPRYPGAGIRAGLARLAATGESPPAAPSRRRSVPAFAGDQLRMQLRRFAR